MNYRDNPWYLIMIHGLEFIGRYYGTYRAFVYANTDPDNMNRLQLIIPHLNATAPSTNWAWPMGMWGGKDYGVQMLPKVGDMVWVSFENGDPNFPLWKHAGYGKEELPSEFSTPQHYGFKTPNGSILVINDNEGEEEILVKLKTGLEWIKINPEQLENEAKLIKLGKEGEEWAVMGETLLEKMESMADKLDTTYKTLINHTHPTNTGPTGPPIQAPALTAQQSALKRLKETFKEWLSGKVKLDK